VTALPGHPPDPSLLPAGTRPARVVRVDRTAVDLATADGPRRTPLPPTAAVVGDWVALDPAGLPVAVLPRRSLLARAVASGASTVQPLAADVDVVLVCVSAHPPPSVRRLERLIALVWDGGATPVVVVTKADLSDDVDAVLRALAPHAPGVDVVGTSAEHGDVAALAPWLTDGTTLALLGTSGAGKSTLLNALAGHEVAATGGVRGADGKGRHTTTHRELFVLPGGAVVLDTPGLRGVALHDASDGVARAFTDVEELGAACRFADCAHTSEPGCAVVASVEAGDLPAARVESWRRLQREAAFHARRTDARLRAQERARWKSISKARRARGERW
jgi:ribosome biogenesis GTPase / thiamine phosphate phosphatase